MRFTVALFAFFVLLASVLLPQRAAAEIRIAKQLVLCNQVGEQIAVALVWDSDDIDAEAFTDKLVTTAKGWFHVDAGACTTITLSPVIVNAVAFSVETHTSKHVWNPGFQGDYFCTDEVGAFELQVTRGQTCSAPYQSVTYYPPATGDMDYSYGPDTWRYTFYRRDFGFIPSGAAASATPKPADALAFDRGTELFNRGEFTTALHFFDRAIQLQPHVALYYFFRAQSQFDLGHYEAALNDADTGMRQASWAAGGLFVAEAEWAMGLLDSAAQDYQKASGASTSDSNQDIGNTVSAALVLRASGHSVDAQALVKRCMRQCRHKPYYAIIQYLNRDLSSAGLLAKMKTSYDKANADGVIGYDLYLRKMRVQAVPHLEFALNGNHIRIGPYIVPTPILRRALAELR